MTDSTSKPFTELMDDATATTQRCTKANTPPAGLTGAGAPDGEVIPLHKNRSGTLLSERNPSDIKYNLVTFHGLKNPIPHREYTGLSGAELLEHLCPESPPIVTDKSRVCYVMAVVLRVAEWQGRTADRAQREGWSPTGKQRSRQHVELCGPAIVLDVDSCDVFGLEHKLKALGVFSAIYSSWSYGLERPDGTVKRGGRVVLFGDRVWTPCEHPCVWAAMQDLLDGVIDPSTMSVAQAMGTAARRSADAPYRRLVLEGGALSIDKLVEKGRDLLPPPRIPVQSARASGEGQVPDWCVRLALEVIPNGDGVDYEQWMQLFGAVHAALGLRGLEFALNWSAQNPKHDPAYAEDKYLKDAGGYEFDERALLFFGRKHAEAQLQALYPADRDSTFAAKPESDVSWITPADAVAASDELSGGIAGARLEQPNVDVSRLTRRHAITAVAFLKAGVGVCWTQAAYQSRLAQVNVPTDVLQEGEVEASALLEAAIAQGRIVIETTGIIHEDADAILAALSQKQVLYQQGHSILVRLLETSNEAAKAHLRQTYGYKGPPGGPDDPARFAAVIPVPITDPAVLRDVISRNVVLKVRKKDESFDYVSITFTGKGPSASFDQMMLKSLMVQLLPQALPELKGVITAPVMCKLPQTGSGADLVRHDSDQILDKPGYDTASGLLFSLRGGPCRVKEAPNHEDAVRSAQALWLPFRDFPFAGSSQDARAVVLLAVLIAVLRRVLPTAPGIAVSAPAMSSGKTLLCQVLAILACGHEVPAVPLSTSFDEQAKTLLPLLMSGTGAVVLDNIVSRFDSAALNAVMTSETYEGRILGLSRMVKVGTQVLMLVNGNRLSLDGDISSRFLLLQLCPAEERAQDRNSSTYTHPDLRAVIVKHRQKLVGAALAIVRAYLLACRGVGGVPSPVAAARTVPGSRFPAIEVLRDALLWVGERDGFLGFRAAEAQDGQREDRLMMLTAVEQAIAAANQKSGRQPGAGASAPEIITQMAAAGRGDMLVQIPGGGRAPTPYEAFSPITLSRWLKKHLVDGIYAGRCLRVQRDPSMNQNVFYVEQVKS